MGDFKFFSCEESLMSATGARRRGLEVHSTKGGARCRKTLNQARSSVPLSLGPQSQPLNNTLGGLGGPMA